MHKIIVAGIDTEVGKTVVSAILTHLMDADYWKPIQCGCEDTEMVRKWIDTPIHPPVYSLKAPLSPHHAARLENISIKLDAIAVPETKRNLIIESVGGIFVPLTPSALSIDLFASWDAKWILVSKHYLGSINHTLLTIEALKQRKIPLLGIIFNGEPNADSEAAILNISKLPLIGRLLPETTLDRQTLQKYAKQWQPIFR